MGRILRDGAIRVEQTGFEQFFWILKLLVWACLLVFAFRLRLIFAYPLVYVYIFTSMIFESVMPLLPYWIELRSLTYSYAYFTASIITLLLACSVLLRIHHKLDPIRLKRSWHLVAAPAAITILGFLDPKTVWPPFRVLDIVYTILTYFGAATVVRMIRQRRSVALGWNLKMVLLALTIPACLHSLVIVAFTFDASISYQSATYWTKATALGSWIILAVGMSEYSPPRRLDRSRPVRHESAAEAGEKEAPAGNILEEKVLCRIGRASGRPQSWGRRGRGSG